MTNQTTFLTKLAARLLPPTEEEREAMRTSRPFFLLILLLLTGLYIFRLYTHPEQRELIPFLSLTGLISLHGVLHWMYMSLLFRYPRYGWLVIPAQGIIAFMLARTFNDLSSIFILFSMLIGEAIGIRNIWQRIISIVFQLVLLVVSLLIFSEGKFEIAWAFSLLPTIGFVIIYTLLFNRQAIARHQAQTLLKELEIAHRQLSDYALQVEELTRARERERIARELHDTLSQGLAGVILQLEAATLYLEEDNPARTLTILGNALSGARQALSDARKTIHTLRQSDATQGDLRTMIQVEINRFTVVTGIPCTLHIASLDGLPELTHTHILRILTEALSNITRHAGAKKLTVSAGCADDQFKLVIGDDGGGFDPVKIPSGHYGILGMQERARLLGAVLSIQSTPGKGTTLTLTIPLDEGVES